MGKLTAVPGMRRRAVVIHHIRDEGGERQMADCVMIGSNKNPDELKMTTDEERIKAFQTILHTKERPRWYIPRTL